MENKGTVISVIWIIIVALIIVLVKQIGIEFLDILILLGIAMLITFDIMGYKANE